MSQITDISPYLVLVAEVLREDWDHDVLADAIIAADMASWTPGRLMREFAGLIADESASPWDLKRAAADPFRREPASSATDPGRVPEVAALRQQLAAMPPLPEHR